MRQYCLDEFYQIAVDITTIATQMHTGNDGFFNTLSMQRVDFVDHFLNSAAAFLASGDCDDAEGATVAASVLDFDEGALTTTAEQRYFAWFGGHVRHAVHVQFG